MLYMKGLDARFSTATTSIARRVQFTRVRKRMPLPHVTLQPGRAVDHAALAQEGAGRAAEGCVVLPRHAPARARVAPRRARREQRQHSCSQT